MMVIKFNVQRSWEKISPNISRKTSIFVRKPQQVKKISHFSFPKRWSTFHDVVPSIGILHFEKKMSYSFL